MNRQHAHAREAGAAPIHARSRPAELDSGVHPVGGPPAIPFELHRRRAPLRLVPPLPPPDLSPTAIERVPEAPSSTLGVGMGIGLAAMVVVAAVATIAVLEALDEPQRYVVTPLGAPAPASPAPEPTITEIDPPSPPAPALSVDEAPAPASHRPSPPLARASRGAASSAAPAGSRAAAPAVGPRPSRAQVAAAFEAARPDVLRCTSGWRGVARVRVVFAPSGRPRAVRTVSGLEHTPEGSCIARAVRGAIRLPAFDGNAFQVDYPFQL